MSLMPGKPSRLWGGVERKFNEFNGLEVPLIAYKLPPLVCTSNCRSRNPLSTSSIVVQHLMQATGNLTLLNFEESIMFKNQLLTKASRYKRILNNAIRMYQDSNGRMPKLEEMEAFNAEGVKFHLRHFTVTCYASKLALARALLYMASKFRATFKSKCFHTIFETQGVTWTKELARSSYRNDNRLSDTIGLREDIIQIWTQCYLDSLPPGSIINELQSRQIAIDSTSSTVAFFNHFENIFRDSLTWQEIHREPLRNILALRTILEILQDTPLPSLSAKVLAEISSPRLFDELQEEERPEFGLLLEIIQAFCWHSLMFENDESLVSLNLLEREANAPSKSKSARTRARKKLESRTTEVSSLSALKLLSVSPVVDSTTLSDSSPIEFKGEKYVDMPGLDDASDTSDEEE